MVNTKPGITVAELLVVMVVIGILSLFLFPAIIDLLAGSSRGYERASLNLRSQTILRKVTEDIRNGSSIRQSNQIIDSNPVQTSGWSTDDVENVLIIARPVTDSDGDFIQNDLTGLPYQNEFVYYEDDGSLYVRTLAHPLAIDNSVSSTCRPAVSGCSEDVLLSDSFLDMSFTFFDQDNQETTTPYLARSVEMSLSLVRENNPGTDVIIESTNQMTFRNLGDGSESS